jgi:hypothetical protein
VAFAFRLSTSLMLTRWIFRLKAEATWIFRLKAEATGTVL